MADPQARSVEESFRRVMDAYGRGRVDEAMSYTASDDDLVVIEPGPHQFWVGRDQVRKGIQLDWDTTEGEMPIELGKMYTTVEGNVAWISGDTKINVNFKGKDLDLRGRFTAIAKRQNGDWKWHTIHIAAPDPGHSEAEAWPTQPQARAGR